MPSYPVQLEVSSPPTFERMQLLVRLVVGMALGAIGVSLGWLWSVLFFVLPAIAAVVISARGPEHYMQQTGKPVWAALRWLLAFSAYMLFVTDRIDDRYVTTEMRNTGQPRVGTALARLITSIPSALALCFIGMLSCILGVVAFFTILFTTRVPASIVEFQTGFLRWQARLAAYHASLVDEYPPFSFGHRADQLPTAMVKP